jgi:hypothetical protein
MFATHLHLSRIVNLPFDGGTHSRHKPKQPKRKDLFGFRRMREGKACICYLAIEQFEKDVWAPIRSFQKLLALGLRHDFAHAQKNNTRV